MKCEKCGAEIPNELLYCENCGAEVTIVPLFEPEVETQIDENLHKIGDDVQEQTIERISTKKKRNPYILGIVIFIVIFSLIAGIIGLVYLLNSAEYKLNRGNHCIVQGDYKEAARWYESALKKQPEQSVDIYIYLTNCYEKLGYDGLYEEYLFKIIDSPDKTEQQEFMAYSKLILLYREGNGFQAINSLLKNCNSDNIKEHFKGYLVSTPVFHYEEGTYSEIIPLKITSPEGYMIYYTLDGSEPTRDSILYTEPIFLDDGTYEFKAVCMNEFGVYSDVIIKKYKIDFAVK